MISHHRRQDVISYLWSHPTTHHTLLGPIQVLRFQDTATWNTQVNCSWSQCSEQFTALAWRRKKSCLSSSLASSLAFNELMSSHISLFNQRIPWKTAHYPDHTDTTGEHTANWWDAHSVHCRFCWDIGARSKETLPFTWANKYMKGEHTIQHLEIDIMALKKVFPDFGKIIFLPVVIFCLRDTGWRLGCLDFHTFQYGPD